MSVQKIDRNGVVEFEVNTSPEDFPEFTAKVHELIDVIQAEAKAFVDKRKLGPEAIYLVMDSLFDAAINGLGACVELNAANIEDLGIQRETGPIERKPFQPFKSPKGLRPMGMQGAYRKFQ